MHLQASAESCCLCRAVLCCAVLYPAHLQLRSGGLPDPGHSLQQLPKHTAHAPHVNGLSVAPSAHHHLWGPDGSSSSSSSSSSNPSSSIKRSQQQPAGSWTSPHQAHSPPQTLGFQQSPHPTMHVSCHNHQCHDPQASSKPQHWCTHVGLTSPDCTSLPTHL